VTPILAPEAKEKLWKILEICLQDRRHAWVLDKGGQYSQLLPDGPEDAPESLGTHEALMEVARRRSE
jgi:polyphosphate kinase